VRDELVADLKVDEGFRRHPYIDTRGVLTIGYGRNLRDVGISAAEAEYLLRNDIEEALRLSALCFPTWILLSPARQDVIANMMLNLGWPRFSGFRLFINAVRRGDWITASHEMLASRWATQVGERAIVLARIMRTGERDRRA
jgi:lysozyme